MPAFVPRGTMTALITPFVDNAARSVDLPALRAIVEQQIAGGIDVLVACGTTGETVTLSHDEWALVVRTVVEAAAGRVPVMAGTGSNDTHKTIELTKEAADLGADAALVVTPYYNRPSQAGLLAHYTAVADASALPIVLYNVPPRTGCNLLPATTAILAQHARIVALKEAAGSMEQIQELQRLTGFSLPILSGEDALCVPTYAIGGAGVISVVSNCAPAHTAALYRDFAAGRTEQAGRNQVALLPLIKALFSEPNPQPVKMAMHLLGLCSPAARLPLLTATDDTKAVLQRELVALGLVAG